MERKVLIRRVEDTKLEGRGDVEKRVFFTPGHGSECVRFSMYKGQPGTQSDLHTNKGDDCTYVLQGQLSLEAGGETIVAKAGDAIFLPNDMPHKATIVGEEELIIISSHCDMCPLYMQNEERQRNEK